MYQQIYDATIEEEKSYGYTEDVLRDRAQVNAHLNVLAANGRLRVRRIFRERVWVHRVEILNENRDEVLEECGGYISVGELNRDSYMKSCLSQTENMGNGFYRVDLMISDLLPDIYVFERESGLNVDLGFNDYSTYYIFTVILNEKDIEDIHI